MQVASASQWPTTVAGWIALTQGVLLLLGIIITAALWYFNIRVQISGLGKRLTEVSSKGIRQEEAIDLLKQQSQTATHERAAMRQEFGRTQQQTDKNTSDIYDIRELINSIHLEQTKTLTRIEGKLDANASVSTSLEKFGQDLVRAFSRRTNYNNTPS